MPYLDIVFIIIFGIYLYWFWGLLRALKSDAPYVPMGPAVVKAMVASANPKKGDLWIDLGSGDGRILIEACGRYGLRGLGIERIGSLRWLSKLIIWRSGLRDRIRIQGGDFFDHDLSEAAVVSLYLLPETHARLRDKLLHELRPGAQIITHRFPIQGLPPESEDMSFGLYVYRIPYRR